MYYNRFRYYDCETGQYLSADPIGLLGGVNPYGYLSNPLKWIDPLGLCKTDVNSETGQGYHNETYAPKPVKPEDALDRWNDFLGPGPHTNIHPRTGIGNGIAVWLGDESLPEFCHHVELDIDDSFQWGRNISHVSGEKTSIKIVGDEIIFTAKILSYENDGILSISLDDDVIFIEVTQSSIVDGYASFFTTPDKIKIYPVEL